MVVEIDEKIHIDRNQNKENERQTNLEKHPDCKFFHKINPDIEGFDIFLEISKMKNYITHSNEEKLNSKFADELLNHGLVVKALDSQSRGPVFKTTGWLQGRLSLSSFRGR